MYKSILFSILFSFVAIISFGQGTFSSSPAFSESVKCEGESAELNTVFTLGTSNNTHTLTWTSATLAGGDVVSVTATAPSDGIIVTNTSGSYTASVQVFGTTVICKLTISDVAGLDTETFTAKVQESGVDVTSGGSNALTVNASPTASIAGIDLTTVCNSDNPVFAATAQNGTIAWTYSGTSSDFVDNTAEDATLNGATSDGTATMIVTSASCGNATANYSIIVTPSVDIDDSGIPNISTDDEGTETASVNVDNVTSATVYAFNFASASSGAQPSVTGFSSASNTIIIGGNTISWTLTTTQIGVNLDGFPIAKAELVLTDGTADNFSSASNVTFTTTGPCSSDVISFTYTALPVEFTYVRAGVLNNSVKVEWETASELNNEVFFIERSVDGLTFTEIGNQQGAGTSLEVIQYSFIDVAPIAGVNYYRIRQVDFDGTMEYSAVVKAEVAKSSFVVSINPTASSSQVQIILGETYEQDLNVAVYDALGRTIMNSAINAGNNLLPIDISNFTNGQYFVRLFNETETITKTFFKL
jgi:hypothetical protein